MPDKEFKAGVHDVMVEGQPMTLQSQDRFKAAIQAVAQLGTDARWLPWTDKPRRMESHRLHRSLHLMNFVTAEFAGPGRTGQSVPVSPIGLGEGEYFAHETAALYDPAQGILLLESGIGGMGPGAIKTYFRQFDPTCIITLPRRIDSDAATKARRFQVIRRLHLQVSMGPVSEVERRLGTEVLQSLGEGYHAQLIDVVLRCGRTRDATLSSGRIRATIDAVIQNSSDQNYESCKVYGKEDEDEPLELIDLIAQPLKSTRNLSVDSDTRKIVHEDKWDALINMHTEFSQQ